MSEEPVQIRLTATPMINLVSPELFVCDLCTAVVSNPQQHFRYHESVLHSNAGSELFLPYLHGLHLPEGAFKTPDKEPEDSPDDDA